MPQVRNLIDTSADTLQEVQRKTHCNLMCNVKIEEIGVTQGEL